MKKNGYFEEAAQLKIQRAKYSEVNDCTHNSSMENMLTFIGFYSNLLANVDQYGEMQGHVITDQEVKVSYTKRAI